MSTYSTENVTLLHKERTYWLAGGFGEHIFIHIYLKKKRSKRYPAKTITDANYADDIALLVNTPNQAETLLHSLEQAATGIDLQINAHKTEYMCYNQTGDISTLDRTYLKLADKFTYL